MQNYLDRKNPTPLSPKIFADYAVGARELNTKFTCKAYNRLVWDGG